MKKKRFLYIIILLVLVGGFIWWRYSSGKNQMTWRTMPAQVRTITSLITATGTINPVTQVNVGTEVSGKIDRLYKDFNDTVKKGELLAKLDTSTLELALEEAQIGLRRATLTANENKLDLDNLAELFEQNMVSQNELQKAQHTYNLALESIESAKLSVQRATTNLNNARIYSPIDGVIIHRSVDEGQTVAASLNTPTLYIIANNLSEMQIEVQIDEADIGKVSEDMRARFTIDAHPDLTFTGRVKQIRLNPIVEQNVVTYKVIVSLSNPDNIIKPGMTANVEIIIDQRRDVLAIQERALQFRPTKEVWEAFKLQWDDSLAMTSRMRQSSGRGSAPPSSSTAPTIQPSSGDAPSSPPSSTETPIATDRGRRQGATTTTTSPTQTVNIWVLQDGTPKQVTIETGVSDGSFIEVISGLSEGAEVITGVNETGIQTQAGASAFGGQMRVIRM